LFLCSSSALSLTVINMSWEVRMSQSKGVPYYFRAPTNGDPGESSWAPPPGMTEGQINALPGASKYLQDDGMRASHLLVKHRESRRPSSWREPNITRSKQEAIEILKGYQIQINGSPDKFRELAKEYSDCSSASKGGDLGTFNKGQMQRPFEEATLRLKVGEMSDVVETDSGVHIIYRTG